MKRYMPRAVVFIHLACRQAYFETGDIVEQVLHFSPALGDEDRAALRGEFQRA